MKRKLLSLLLVLAMVFTLFPVAAFADDSTADPISVTKGDLCFDVYQGETADESYAVVKAVSRPGVDTVTIPDTVNGVPVVGIGDGAFKCNNISSVTIPESVIYVGEEAFMGCSDLATVNFVGDSAYLGIDCFRNCTSLTLMWVPNAGVIHSGTFAGCTNLSIVVLGDGNMIIEEGAFADCTSLERIRLPVSIEQIYTKDFEDMEAILVIGDEGTEKELSIAQKFANEMGFLFEAKDSASAEETWFTDVNRGNYYTVPVLWGSMTGVVAGYGNGKFGINDNCTRAQMIAFLWRLNRCPKPEAEKTYYHDFCDVPDDDYYTDAVQWAYEQDITAGTGLNKDGKDTFSPNEYVTREQVLSLLWRMDGKPKATATTTPFTDVSSSGYYYKALLWANENKVVAGTAADKFSPNKVCTREQIITFMYRNLYHMYRSDDPTGKFV